MPQNSGELAGNGSHKVHANHLETMEAAIQAIAECGVIHEFYADGVAGIAQ